MDKKSESPVSDDVGVNKKWLQSLIEKDLEKPKEWTSEEVRKMSAASKPKSRLQEILQAFYYTLSARMHDVKLSGEEIVEQPDEDMFDKWCEEMDIEQYPQRFALMQVFNTLLRACHLPEQQGYAGYCKEDFEEAFRKIVERCLTEPEYVEVIRKVIDEKYPGLVAEFKTPPTVEELNDLEQADWERRRTSAVQKIESNVDELRHYLSRIEKASKTDFEEIAMKLNNIVIFGTDAWELLLYSCMSPFAPRLIINSLDYRANIHTMLAGDVSTAKSKILKIMKRISPKALEVDETTKASLEGPAPAGKGDEIEEGILDEANKGVMIIEEFTRAIATLPLLRRAMDCEHVTIYKKGLSKSMDVNTTLIVAVNPSDDFFIEETEFRRQLPFKEGIISRFDTLIPLTATQLKNEMLADKLDLFGIEGNHSLNFAEIREHLTTLSEGMSIVTRVSITPEQQSRLKEAFLRLNKLDEKRQFLNYRPLVLLRDLETLARFVNTISSVNFSKRRIEEGVLHADDYDIDKAIQLWENLLQFRIQVYAHSKRALTTIGDEICLYLLRQGGMDTDLPISEVKREFVETRQMISKSTFYKEIQSLRENGRIIQKGERDSKLRLVIQ